MRILLSRKDIVWGYFAQFFGIASGIITLPIILRMLSTEEIGMNYLMLTVGSMVCLFDFGFAPQFGRNITYVFSGAQRLKKEGIDVIIKGSEINYHLLATMIHTARFVYRRLAFIVLLTMLTLGSWYIYKVTSGFANIDNSFLIWVIYSISTFFNIYYSYYTSLLTGKGLIMESRKATVYSRLAYIFFTFVFLYSGMGLMGVSIANLLTPFVNRYISYHFFFTSEVKSKISVFEISNHEKVELFKVIWYNSRKLGLVFLGSFAISKLSMFLAGLYLSLSEIASYGLMMQLVGLIATVSGTLFGIYQPRFSALRVEGNEILLFKEFAFTMNTYYSLYILGASCLFFLGPLALRLIGSNAVLPSLWIVLVYALIIFLEGNHSNFATLIVTRNDIPFVIPSLVAGGLIGLGSFINLKFTAQGIFGLVIVQGVSQIIYNNWKWPLVVLREFNISIPAFLYTGLEETRNKFYNLIHD